MAIKALEQEPCEDVVSRAQVIDLIHGTCSNGDITYFRGEHDANCFIELVRALPPVTPKPKTGHWIYREDMLDYECSECGRVIETHRFENPYIRYPYCHCGAKMVEQQESEDKE